VKSTSLADRKRAVAEVEEAFEGFASRSNLIRLRERIAVRVGGGIEPSGYPMLRWIEAWAPVRTTDLAERLGIDASAVSRRVSDLQEVGLVTRVGDPADHRANLLELTPAGRRMLTKLRKALSGILDQALAEWPTEDVLALADILARFTSALADVTG
jgi:DNA-binding MarR family transcriptional regulator